jgi:hypothetical protein
VGGVSAGLIGVTLMYLDQSGLLGRINGLGEYDWKLKSLWGNRDLGVGNTTRITVLVCSSTGVLISGFATSLFESMAERPRRHSAPPPA